MVIEKLVKEKTNNLWIQLFRYTFVGGSAFLVDFFSLFVLTEYAGINYLISAAIAFTLGLILNYILSLGWVFKERTLGTPWLEFAIFAIIGVIGLLLNELIIWFFTEGVHFHYLASKIVSTAIVYLYNFFARKYILFR